MYYKAEGRRGEWLYLELDGAHHLSQPAQDGERAENLLIPELRYDNLKLRSPEWFSSFMKDVRAKAADGSERARERQRKARGWRRHAMHR